MPRTSAVLQPSTACRKPISRCIAPSCSPFVRASVNPAVADLMRQLHRLRLQYELFSDANPCMAPHRAARPNRARNNRKPAAADNPFIAMQENVSRQIVAALDALARRESRHLPSACSWRVRFADAAGRRRRRSCDPRLPLRRGCQECAASRAHCRDESPNSSRTFAVGGSARGRHPRAALCRHGARGGGRTRLRNGAPHPRNSSDVPLSAFKATVREQFYMLADRHRSGARRDSVDAPGRSRNDGARRSI